jgi:hypothetical protein
LTPWIAGNDGLKLLGEAVGLDLACESCEVAVGPFSADILARDITSNGLVIIENQLEKTNHDHFGKTLTYAAILGANTAIWIARSFTEEHRKAIEWLNEKTKGDLLLFAVELQVWQIGGSDPAPRFEVVAGPNEAVRNVQQELEGKEQSPLRQLQLEFFSQVRQQLLKAAEWASLMQARPQQWMNIPIGRWWANLSVNCSAWNHTVYVQLYIRNKVALVVLEQLRPMQADIEREVGEPLQWDPNPNAKDKVIRLQRSGDIADKAQWPELTQWLVAKTVAMNRAFKPRVQALEVSSDEIAGV